MAVEGSEGCVFETTFLNTSFSFLPNLLDFSLSFPFYDRLLLNIPAAAAESLQMCLTLCNPIDGSPPGFSIPGILQARVLEWGAIAFSSCFLIILQKVYKHMYTYTQSL